MNSIREAAAGVGLNNIHEIVDLWQAGKAESLIDYTRVTRVEPIVLLDNAVLFNDLTPEVMQSLLNTFAGYYLQAVAISAMVGKINIIRHLDKLNPSRNPVDSGAYGVFAEKLGGRLFAQENYKFRLPRLTDQVALESIDRYDLLPVSGGTTIALEDDNKEKRTGFAAGKESIQSVKELSNLSVGKLLSVEITDGQHKAEIPVAIRLMAASLPSQTVAHILSLGKKDTSVMARWHGWRSGRLAFWKDLVMCNDLIEDHRNALMHDKDGLYRQIVARKSKNRFAGILSGNPSVATASNMAVITKETADKIELETVGTLNDFRTRQKLFEPTSLMILVVINPDYDRATFYYRGIAEKTDVSMRDLKAANKGSGPDVADILRAFTQGHAPSL
jgi:hypothetical protein